MRCFFKSLFYCSGVFPRSSGFRSGARGGPEASFFSSFRAFFPLFWGAVCTVPGKTQAFRSIRLRFLAQFAPLQFATVGEISVSAVFAVPLVNATRALAPRSPFFSSLFSLFVH